MTNIQTLIASLAEGSIDETTFLQRIHAYGPEALPELIDLYKSPDPDIRWGVIRALAEIDHAEVPPILQSAIEDTDISVRQCAYLALRQQPNVSAIPVLVAALSNHDRLSARLAADALVALGEHATGPLLDTMDIGPHSARVQAIRALALTDDLQAVPALFRALDDESFVIEYWAEVGLQRRGVGMTFFKP